MITVDVLKTKREEIEFWWTIHKQCEERLHSVYDELPYKQFLQLLEDSTYALDKALGYTTTK